LLYKTEILDKAAGGNISAHWQLPNLLRLGLFGSLVMQIKIEDVSVGTVFEYQNNKLYIPKHEGPSLDGFVFAKHVEPDLTMKPPGHWVSIPRGKPVETLPGESVKQERRNRDQNGK
jgi:hypothetical protein